MRLASSARVPPTQESTGDARAAFEAMKGLAGTWTIGEEGREFPATFTVVAKGKALAQDSGFFGVWSVDGEGILLSLFVDDGYHARMRSRRVVAAGGTTTIDLELVDAGGYQPSMPLARHLTFTIGPDGLAQRWIFQGAQGDTPLDLVFRRQ